MAQQVGFFVALHSIYAAVATLATAVGRLANSADNLGQWAEEQTATFVDEARLERAAKVKQIQEKLALEGVESASTKVVGTSTKARKATSAAAPAITQ